MSSDIRKMVILGGIAVVGIFGLIVLSSAMYTVDETEQAVVLQFGAPVGEPVTEPGLHFKTPFVQEVRKYDKRLLAWDGQPNQIPTKGREFIEVDTMARWRITNALTFLQNVRDEQGARTRLDDILDSTVRDQISSTDLVEIVRSSTWDVSEEELEAATGTDIKENDQLTKEIEVGREQLQSKIFEQAALRVPDLGIELVDFRIKRLNYIASVQQQVFQRMISERERIAAEFRSEGQGEASKIEGDTARQLAEIESNAKREAEEIRGRGDAEAARLYNEAFGTDPEFYRFVRTLESYRKSLGARTTLLLGSDSAYLRYLESGSQRDDGAKND